MHSIIRTPSIQVVVHMRWPVRDHAAVLSPAIIERLTPYLTRYAQTLGILVHAIGGTPNHLHLVLDIPPTRTLDEIKDELQKASARFLRGVLNLPDFAWSSDGLYIGSVQWNNLEEIAAYVRDNSVRHTAGQIVPEWEWDGTDPLGEEDEDKNSDDDLPGWLRDALSDDEEDSPPA